MNLGEFEQLVLLAILRLRGDAYGRAILRDVQTHLARDIAAGAVHATLTRLERKGLLSSHLAAGSEIRAGRPRRYYRLEPRGRRALEHARTAVEHLWRGFRTPLTGRS